MAEWQRTDQGRAVPTVEECWVARPHPTGPAMLLATFQRDRAAPSLGRR